MPIFILSVAASRRELGGRFFDVWLEMSLQQKPDRPVFVLRLQPLKGVDPIKALRWVLKHLLRQHGMRALSCDEEKPYGEHDETLICEGSDNP
jgi:hypothetical protein